MEQTLTAIVKARPLPTGWLDDEEQLKMLEHCCCRTRSFGGGGYVGCIGFVDGCIFHTLKPDDVPNPADWRCDRKNCYGLNCIGVCDGRLRFIFFSVESPGNVHDSQAFSATRLGYRVSLGHGPGGIPVGYFFSGDGAFKLGPALVVPVGGPPAPGSANDAFNYVHAQYRATIERALGVLMRRWGVFWRPLECSTPLKLLIIQAAVRLHNLCMQRPDGAGERVGRGHETDMGTRPTMKEVRRRHLRAYKRLDDLDACGGNTAAARASVTRDILVSMLAQSSAKRPVRTRR